MSQLQLLILCFIFSLICSIIKQVHDTKYYHDKSLKALILRITLSNITAIIVSLLGVGYVDNQYLLLGISGAAGLFGLSTIRIITRFLLGQKIIRIQITDDDEPIDITYNGRRLDDEIEEELFRE